MSLSIVYQCSQCKKYQTVEVSFSHNQKIYCPSCQKQNGEIKNIDFIFENCPLCQCRQFYVQKNFNQAVGCLIMGIGIILVPKTYGLSLPFFALLDWLLYRKMQTIVICYRCSAEFHGFTPPKHLKSFMHHIGMKYDKDR